MQLADKIVADLRTRRDAFFERNAAAGGGKQIRWQQAKSQTRSRLEHISGRREKYVEEFSQMQEQQRGKLQKELRRLS